VTRDLDPKSTRVLVGIPLVLAMLSMIGPFSIDTPFPAFSQMERDFSVGAADLQLIVTVYMLAFAVASLFHGPLSDAIGRRPVIVGSLAVYGAASVAMMWAPSLEWVLAGRVVQGISAGGAMIVSRTIIRDLFDGEDAQRLMSRVAVIFGVAPAVAPIAGGLLLQVGDWPLIFGFLGVFALVLVLATVAVLPESHPAGSRVPLRAGEVVRGLVEVVKEAEFHTMAWGGTLVFAAQFLYIGGAAIFLGDLLGQGELDYWKLFVPMIGAMMVGSSLSGRLAGRVAPARMVSIGFALALGGAVLAAALALTSWGVELPWAVVGISVVALGNGLAYPNIQLLMLDLVPRRRGAVMSAGSFVTLVFNAVVAVAITPVVGTSVLGFALTALVLVALGWACWRWHTATAARRTASAARVAVEAEAASAQ
jgi:DHA1 family bicyclomycin/chloramphenicol resistance-like MFS transporter